MAKSEYGFGAPFIDVDEWRDDPRRHRYVHGGFEDSHTRFSIYLPPPELYQGRFFQFLQGGAGGFESSLAQGSLLPGLTGSWVFDLVFDELGGYLLESNQGHFSNEGDLGLEGDLALFGASAETALYSKEVAAEMLGSAPHHGYIWGPSGGGHRTIHCIENRPDVWAGGSPHVIGGGGGAQSWSAWVYWWLYCRDKRADIVDATAPGGSGDPFATLTNDEREALATLYRRGWPRGAENQLSPFFSWLFSIGGMKNSDPTYFDDFWTKIGYLGHDNPERMAPLLVDQTFTVARALTRESGETYVANPIGTMAVRQTAAAPASGAEETRGSTYGLVVDGDLGDADKNYMCRATVLTGKAKGREVHVSQGPDNAVIGFGLVQPDLFDGVEPGDQIRLDNRELVALGHLWKYAVDVEMMSVQDPVTGETTLATEYRGVGAVMVDGRPIFPQRPAGLMSGGFTGQIDVKAIHVAATLDCMVMPAWVPKYQRMVADHLGDAIDDHYRLWWAENGTHGGLYAGITSQALRDLVRWAEDGIAPPSSTAHHFTSDGGIVLTESAAERGGVQPVVQASANGDVRADIKLGETVTFAGRAQQPPGTGTIVYARWEFEGNLEPTGWMTAPPAGPEHEHEIDDDAETIEVEATHSYTKAGTYIASFRVGAHRDGIKGQGVPAENYARVRVVVS